MVLSVNTNILSITAQRNLQRSTAGLNKSLERLSLGVRINRAGDDAAGLAISEGLRSQVRGLNQAARNANDGLSMIGTAESAMNAYTDILQRIRELGIQSANDTNSPANRNALNRETSELLEELQRIATTVDFNGTNLLDGTFTQKQLQVGAQANQTIEFDMGNLHIGQVARATGGVIMPWVSLATGELLLNGFDIAPSLPDGVSTVSSSGSAISIANAINLTSNLHQVRAQVG